MFQTILFDLLVLVVFVTMLSVLVAAHELGHYLAAKWMKMGVEEFAIGFGKPRLFTYFRHKYRLPISDKDAQNIRSSQWDDQSDSNSVEKVGLNLAQKLESGDEVHESHLVESSGKYFLDETTQFTFRAWPLGGFVRIKGMMPAEDGRETEIPGGFYSKSPLARLIVLVAGPLFSVMFGVLVLIPFNMIVGKAVQSHDPVVMFVPTTMPAGQAGVKSGDKIVSVNGAAISDFYQVVVDVRNSKGEPLKFVINRNGKLIEMMIRPTLDPSKTPVMGPDLEPTEQMAQQYKIGVLTDRTTVPVGFREAVVSAFLVPVQTFDGLAAGFTHPSQLKDQVGGPETIVRMTAAATKDSLVSVVSLAALLSISLGVLNLLPVPPLDGGQMVIAFAELLRGGRRLSMKVQGIVFTTGFVLVGMLVFSVLILDMNRWRTAPANDASSIQIQHQSKK